jgi:hypothetical protein
MKSCRLFLCVLSCVPLLSLSACGEGWETVPYTGVPYGERTAGTGVAYVRKTMARERGPILAPEMKQTPPVAAPPVAPSQADKVFDARQKK